MTGYGLAKGQEEGYTVSVEIRSLNSKFLDTHLKIPKQLSDKELEIRNILSDALVRGKVSLSIELKHDLEGADRALANEKLFKVYYESFKRLAKEVGASEDDLFRLALQSPDVLTSEEREESIVNREWLLVQKYLRLATEQCNEFRSKEGAKLAKELLQYIHNIGKYRQEIHSLEGERMEVIKERIRTHIKEIGDTEQFDENRFEQEMIYYIEKLDISEELVRLKAHLDYFKEVSAMKESQGKKLGFISQEIGREINTIGAKANFAAVQRHVVCMKDELEKIKEQLLNVL